jgi:hypothetical protein
MPDPCGLDKARAAHAIRNEKQLARPHSLDLIQLR